VKLTTPVWQKQYRDTYIPFIEGLLHCREQYERLQAMPEFKKQLTILSSIFDGITILKFAKV